MFKALFSFAPAQFKIATIGPSRAEGSVTGSEAQGVVCKLAYRGNGGDSRPHYSPPSRFCLPVDCLPLSFMPASAAPPYAASIPSSDEGPNKGQDESEGIRLGWEQTHEPRDC